MLIVGALIVGGVNAYMTYEIMGNILPSMENLVRGAVDQINNKLDLILEAVK